MFCLSAAPRRWYNNFANLSASSEANLIYSPVGAGEIGLPAGAGGLLFNHPWNFEIPIYIRYTI